MMPRSTPDLSTRDRHDIPPCFAGAAAGRFPDGAVTSHRLAALRCIPLAAIERASGMNRKRPDASPGDAKHLVFAKSRTVDRAATAFWHTVGVGTDCKDLAGNVHSAEERSRPTALRQDKSRKVRPGRTVEEWKRINHFVRGALWHRTSSLRTSYWKITTTCTSRPTMWSTWAAGCSAAPRVFRPFCPGRAPWQTAMPRPRSWMRE